MLMPGSSGKVPERVLKHMAEHDDSFLCHFHITKSTCTHGFRQAATLGRTLPLFIVISSKRRLESVCFDGFLLLCCLQAGNKGNLYIQQLTWESPPDCEPWKYQEKQLKFREDIHQQHKGSATHKQARPFTLRIHIEKEVARVWSYRGQEKTGNKNK